MAKKVIVKREAKKAKVLALMLKASRMFRSRTVRVANETGEVDERVVPAGWVTGPELEVVAGWRFVARLFDLKKDGLIEYESRHLAGSVHIYRIVQASDEAVALDAGWRDGTPEVPEGKESSPTTNPKSGSGSRVVGLTTQMVDEITDEQWNQILDGQWKMKGWARKRIKRAIRLLTEGRIYDDPNEDGRFGPREARA